MSLDEAIRQLRIFSNSISVYLKNAGGETWRAEEHNILCRQIFHTLLYGLVARK